MENKKQSIMFYEICRLCLEEQGHCDIFDKTDLYENIFICTGLKMSLSDNLPQKICLKCLEIVNKAAELRILAIKNDTHLNLLFGSSDNDVSEPNSEDLREMIIKSHIERHKYVSPRKNPAIATFISVRKDLFDSSVAENSISKTTCSQADSSQENCLNDCKTEIKSNDSKIANESSQADSSLDQMYTRKTLYDGTVQYECNKCSKTFKVWKKYYLHSRLHNKVYGCPLDACGKKFSTKGDLQKHIRTHTGEKPYNCDICDKSFAQRGTLKTHKETVHG